MREDILELLDNSSDELTLHEFTPIAEVSEWGFIQGDINRQTDLINLLEQKADKLDTYNKEEVDAKIESAKPTDYEEVKNKVNVNTENIDILFSNKQDLLIAGDNIKTLNGESILGAGNIEIKGGQTDIGLTIVNGLICCKFMEE